MRILAVLIFVLGIIPKGQGQNNYIVFQPDTSYIENIVRIYIDRAGNAYPLGDYVHKEKFRSHSRRDCTYANLRAYFTCFDAAEASRAYARYRVHDFDELQQMIIRNCADSINKKLHGRKLVVLIHGFNDTAVAEYAILKRQINKTLAPEIPFYLEVYWDGLKANSEKFLDIAKIWDRANATAPYAACTLRKLFAMAGDADTYIIAHSLGACVATRLLFNPNDRRRFPLKKQWAALPTPSQSRVHLALLAPAIAGGRIFKHFCQTVPNGQCANYKSVLIGYNKHDYATTKKCRWLLSFIDHSTALGCHGRIVRRVGKLVNDRCPALQFSSVDFSNCPDSRHSHHIFQYALCGKFDVFIAEAFTAR